MHYLEQRDVVVVGEAQVVVRMRNHPLHFHLLTEISVREPSGDAELDRPAGHVRVAETVDVERINSRLRFSAHDRRMIKKTSESFLVLSFFFFFYTNKIGTEYTESVLLTFRRSETRSGPIDRQ